MYPSQSWETVIGGSDVLFTKLGNGKFPISFRIRLRPPYGGMLCPTQDNRSVRPKAPC